MAIALRGALNNITGAASNGSDVTLTFDTITPPLENDIVVVFGGHGTDTSTLTAPSGNTSGAYTLISENTGAAPIFGMWLQRMGATPDTSVTCSGGGDAQDAVVYGCYVLSGVDTTTAQDQTATASGPTTSTNPDCPSITTQTANAWVIACAGSNVRDTSPGTISGYANQMNSNRNDTNDVTIGSGTFLNVGADAENPAAFSSWLSGTWYAVTAAFKAATGVSDNTEEPGTGTLQFDTASHVPVRIVNHITNPGTKALQLDQTQVPSAEIEHNRDVPLASPSPAFTGAAPTVLIDRIVTPAMVEMRVWSVTGLQFQGVTPTIAVSGGGDKTITMGAPDALLFTGNVSDPLVNHIVRPATRAMLFTGAAPTAEIVHTRFMPVATALLFAESTPDPLVNHIRGPPLDELLFAAAAPSAEIEHNRNVPLASPGLSFSSDAATVTVGFNITVPVGSLLFDGGLPSDEVDHFRDVDTVPLVFSSDAPVVKVGIIVRPTTGAFAFGENHVPSAERDYFRATTPDALLFSSDALTVSTGIVRDPGLDTLILTGAVPSAEIVHSKSPAPDELQFSGIVPNVITGNPEEPSTGSLLFNGKQPSAEIGHSKSPAADGLIFSSDAVSARVTQLTTPLLGAIGFTGNAPQAGLSYTILVGSTSLAFNADAPAPQLAQIAFPGLATLLFSSDAVSVIRGTIRTPSSAALALIGSVSNFGFGFGINTSSIELTGTFPLLGPGQGNVSFAGFAPLVFNQHGGKDIGNPDATTDVPNNYAQCDYTGFRQLPGSLKMTWNKYAVRKKSWESRHPQDFQKDPSNTRQKGSKRPEQEDRFLADNEITQDDL